MKGRKKINILFIIDEIMDRGGTENHIFTLASSIDKARFNASICYFRGGAKYVQFGKEKLGIDLVGVDLDRIYSFDALRKAFRLSRVIRERDIDIVQTFHFKSDTYGVMVSKLSGVSRIISSRRDMGDLKKRRQILLNRVMNRFINRYIMVCGAVGRRFHEIEGIPEDRMVTLYNGVDLSRFDPARTPRKNREELGIKEGDFVVGTVAHFRPEKAYHIFFEGINKVKGSIKNLKVLVVGDGGAVSMRKQFEDYCKGNGLGKVVKFIGHVEDIENYLPFMDVFCLVPNKNEGFSNSILEAMAMGRPIIATNVGGNAEAVVNGETGFIIPPNNSEMLAELILKLYTDSDMRLKMGKKARKRAEEVFPLKLMVKKHEDLYEEVSNR
jgi:L-malate glycosyltransferase